MTVLIFIIVCGFLLGVLSPYFPAVIWPLELLSHFQLQYFIGGFFLLSVVRDMRLAGLIVAGLALCFWTLWPYLKPAPESGTAEGTKLRILQVNVFKFNEQKRAMVDYIRMENPDVVVAAEVTPEWEKALSGLEDFLPHVFEKPRPGSHGMAVYSRFPLDRKETHYPDGEKIPALSFDLAAGENRISFLSLHPATPTNPQGLSMRDCHFDFAASWVAAQSGPVLVLGDFNVTPFSPSYRALLSRTKLASARDGRGLFPSWPTSVPPFLGIPIDHILVNAQVRVLSFEAGPNVGSDHRPTLTVVAF